MSCLRLEQQTDGTIRTSQQISVAHPVGKAQSGPKWLVHDNPEHQHKSQERIDQELKTQSNSTRRPVNPLERDVYLSFIPGIGQRRPVESQLKPTPQVLVSDPDTETLRQSLQPASPRYIQDHFPRIVFHRRPTSKATSSPSTCICLCSRRHQVPQTSQSLFHRISDASF